LHFFPLSLLQNTEPDELEEEDDAEPDGIESYDEVWTEEIEDEDEVDEIGELLVEVDIMDV
jgi:hypothetical protein